MQKWGCRKWENITKIRDNQSKAATKAHQRKYRWFLLSRVQILSTCCKNPQRKIVVWPNCSHTAYLQRDSTHCFQAENSFTTRVHRLMTFDQRRITDQELSDLCEAGMYSLYVPALRLPPVGLLVVEKAKEDPPVPTPPNPGPPPKPVEKVTLESVWPTLATNVRSSASEVHSRRH